MYYRHLLAIYFLDFMTYIKYNFKKCDSDLQAKQMLYFWDLSRLHQ